MTNTNGNENPDSQGSPLAAVEVIAKEISQEITNAIALKSLSAQFNYDKRIPGLWNKTWEAHAFTLTQSSIALNLVMTLMRIWDSRRRNDVNSLLNLFGALTNNGAVRDDIRDAINVWLTKYDRQIELDDHLGTIVKGAQRFNEVRVEELVTKTRNLRHKFIAHSATERGNVELPEYGFLDALVDETVSIFDSVSVASIGHHFAFDEDVAHWDNCTALFFESIVAGQSANGENGV